MKTLIAVLMFASSIAIAQSPAWVTVATRWQEVQIPAGVTVQAKVGTITTTVTGDKIVAANQYTVQILQQANPVTVNVHAYAYTSKGETDTVKLVTVPAVAAPAPPPPIKNRICDITINPDKTISIVVR